MGNYWYFHGNLIVGLKEYGNLGPHGFWKNEHPWRSTPYQGKPSMWKNLLLEFYRTAQWMQISWFDCCLQTGPNPGKQIQLKTYLQPVAATIYSPSRYYTKWSPLVYQQKARNKQILFSLVRWPCTRCAIGCPSQNNFITIRNITFF